MRKVLIITYYWPPSGGAGVQRWLKFVKYLPESGWEPIVLTVKEESASYAQSDHSLLKEVDPAVRVIRTDSFEPYSIYLKLSGKKQIPFGGFSNEGSLSFSQKIFRFIRGNIFIPDPRKGWNRYAKKAALELFQREKIEVVITTGPPHSTHLTGLYLKRKTGVKWISDFRDPWTDIYYYKDLSHTAFAKWWDKKLEKKVFRFSDKIITVGNELKKLLVSNSSGILNQEKTEVITNGYDSSDFEGFDRKRENRFVITYSGTISSYYRPEKFVSALQGIPDEIKGKIFVRFVGNIPPDMSDLINKSGINSEYISYVPHEESINYLFKASVLLLLIPDVKENKGILTGKFFEYLATGIPILAVGPKDGDVAGILNETGAGTIFDYNEVTAIRDKIVELYSAEPEKTVSVPKIEQYSRKNLTRKLVKIIEDIC